MTARLPASASVAQAQGGVLLHAPSAARNAGPIADLLAANAPAQGDALELASGTGQHVIRFASRCPRLHWHPTEIAADRMASIDAHAQQAGLRNMASAARLDVTAPGWGRDRKYDVIVVINLLHLVSLDAAGVVLQEAAQALACGGVLMVYGPFKRAGVLTSAGDVQFDTELRAADRSIGYKDDIWVEAMLDRAGLKVEVHDMAANNLAFIARGSA